MKLTFNIDDIRYLRIKYEKENSRGELKLAFKEKLEKTIIAVSSADVEVKLEPSTEVDIEIICEDGLYKTSTILREVWESNGSIYYSFDNPCAIDYVQNREFFRIYAEYDCIYTVDTAYGHESYNATTYDISVGGVSIIMDENILSRTDAALLIMLDSHNIKSHVKFMRSELYGDSNYKLSFEFTDLSERDVQILEQLCVNKQLKLANSDNK